MVDSRDSSGGGSALAAFRRGFFASMLFLCLLVDSAWLGRVATL